MVIKQEAQIRELQDKVEASLRREIKPNLIVHGILEDDDEQYPALLEKFKKFFKEKMKIESETAIVDAYRKGPRKFQDRAIMLRLQHVSDKSIIFENVSNIKGLRNVRKQLFAVQDNMTDIQKDTREYYRSLRKENNEKETADQ